MDGLYGSIDSKRLKKTQKDSKRVTGRSIGKEKGKWEGA